MWTPADFERTVQQTFDLYPADSPLIPHLSAPQL
jgi:hypothetical protein